MIAQGFFGRSPRYLVGGALCAALHNGILIGADAVGVPYQIGLLISAAITVPLGFLFHSMLTFERAPSPRASETISLLARRRDS